MIGRRARLTGLLLAGVLASTAACTATGASASPVATDRVDLPRSYRFAPAAIEVAPGTTVTWTNSDNFTHSVQFADEAAPGQVLAPGATARKTFDSAGTFTYVCTFHAQDMQGTVTVAAP